MPDTIFGKILRGELPCHKVYEDDRVLAFLDINPLSRGHTLIIPKEVAAALDQLSDESAAALGRVMPRIARAIMAATGTRDFNVLLNNGARAHQAVLHVHFHIIPKADDGGGLGLGWRPQPLDETEAARLAADLSARIAGA
jgi:histidine triad (HIT) family protein